MRWLLALVLAFVVSCAEASPPPCWPPIPTKFSKVELTPAELGDVMYSASTVGLVYGWTCKTADGQWWKIVVGGTWSQFAPDWAFIADTLARGTDADRAAAWNKYVTGTGMDARLQPDADKIKSLLPSPPPPPTAPAPGTWVVAPTTICPTLDKDASGKCVRRSTYAWANNTRSTLAAPEKVNIGSDCNPAVGASGFYGVLGRSDRVAPCVKR